MLRRMILCLLGTSILLAAGSADWRIALCVSEDPAHGMNLAWRTAGVQPDARVEWTKVQPGPKPEQAANWTPAGEEIVRLLDGSQVYAYSAALKDLQPSTSYLYRVGEPGNYSEWLEFHTAAATPEPFRFLYFGDPQNDILSQCSRVFRSAIRTVPDPTFLYFAGDVVSIPSRDEMWAELFEAGSFLFRQFPLAAAAGNHGYNEEGVRKDHISFNWRPHFTFPENGLPELPETNYSFRVQGVLFVILNSLEFRAEQAHWLDRTLADAPERWRIIGMHYPFYSTGEGRDGRRIRQAFLDVVDKHQVDLVLQGHDHTFGRTKPLRGGKPVKAGQKGTIFVNSVSGPKQYQLDPPHPEVFAATASNTQLFHVVEVSPQRLVLLSYAADGTLLDRVEIQPAPGR